MLEDIIDELETYRTDTQNELNELLEKVVASREQHLRGIIDKTIARLEAKYHNHKFVFVDIMGQKSMEVTNLSGESIVRFTGGFGLVGFGFGDNIFLGDKVCLTETRDIRDLELFQEIDEMFTLLDRFSMATAEIYVCLDNETLTTIKQ